MDPRFRKRRVAVRRQEGRRRLRFLAGSTAVAVAVGGAVGVTRSPLLDVDRVEVRGTSRTPRPDVLAASGLDAGPLMTEVDTRGVVRRVEALPWVERARARRAWPNSVVIEVTERTPAAALAAAGGGWALVDGAGRVLEVGAARPQGVPVVAGATAPGPAGSELAAGARDPLRVAAALPAQLRPRVAEVVVVPGGEVVLRLAAPGGEVRLGRPDALGPKLAAAATVLEKANPRGLRVLDVRVPQAPVLTRR